MVVEDETRLERPPLDSNPSRGARSISDPRRSWPIYHPTYRHWRWLCLTRHLERHCPSQSDEPTHQRPTPKHIQNDYSAASLATNRNHGRQEVDQKDEQQNQCSYWVTHSAPRFVVLVPGE